MMRTSRRLRRNGNTWECMGMLYFLEKKSKECCQILWIKTADKSLDYLEAESRLSWSFKWFFLTRHCFPCVVQNCVFVSGLNVKMSWNTQHLYVLPSTPWHFLSTSHAYSLQIYGSEVFRLAFPLACRKLSAAACSDANALARRLTILGQVKGRSNLQKIGDVTLSGAPIPLKAVLKFHLHAESREHIHSLPKWLDSLSIITLGQQKASSRLSNPRGCALVAANTVHLGYFLLTWIPCQVTNILNQESVLIQLFSLPLLWTLLDSLLGTGVLGLFRSLLIRRDVPAARTFKDIRKETKKSIQGWNKVLEAAGTVGPDSWGLSQECLGVKLNECWEIKKQELQICKAGTGAVEHTCAILCLQSLILYYSKTLSSNIIISNLASSTIQQCLASCKSGQLNLTHYYCHSMLCNPPIIPTTPTWFLDIWWGICKKATWKTLGMAFRYGSSVCRRRHDRYQSWLQFVVLWNKNQIFKNFLQHKY